MNHRERKSPRWQKWDYSQEGSYYITVCSDGRALLFGEINNKKFYPSAIGNIVLEEWERSFRIRRELLCDAFVLMPDHLHAIVRIDNSMLGTPGGASGSDHNIDKFLWTHGGASLRKNGMAHRPPKSISSFIAGFKSVTTKRINEHRGTPRMPVWQSRFHDHVIRNHEEFESIYWYIQDNPAKWGRNRNLK